MFLPCCSDIADIPGGLVSAKQYTVTQCTKHSSAQHHPCCEFSYLSDYVNVSPAAFTSIQTDRP